MLPLELSAREQCFLAEVCSLARSVCYDLNTGKDVDYAKIGDQFTTILLKSEFRPTEFDGMYDRLHRSGSNS